MGKPQREEAPGPSGNKIDFDLLHHVAKALGDPDAEYPLLVRDGVPLGVTPRGGENPMPRAHAIYEEKQKWALPEMDWDNWAQEASWADNYKSASHRGHVEGAVRGRGAEGLHGEDGRRLGPAAVGR